MQLSDIQKENIRNSYIAYVTAIPVENADDLKQIQDILRAIAKNRLGEITVPEKMVKSVAQLEEYVKLHLEINDDFPEIKRYLHDLQKHVNAKMDTVINEGKVEGYKKEQKNSSPKRANNTPVTQAFIDIFNIHAQLLTILDCYVNSQSRSNSYLREEDIFSSQTIPLFPIPLSPSMKVKKPMGHESSSLFFDAEEEEELANNYSYQLSPLRDMRLTGTPTLQPSFSLFNVSDDEMDLFSFEAEQQQREDNKKESKLKSLQSIMRNKESRQLLFGASIRFEPFLVLGEDANNFAFLLLTENNLGLRLYAQNLFNEHHFKDWGFDVALNYLLNLAPFDRHGMLDKDKPSRDFLLSLTPSELNLLDTLIKDKKFSIDQLSKMNDFSELENLIRLNRFHPFSHLPEELQKNILNYLSIKDVAKLRLASKSTKNIVDELVIRPDNIARLVDKLSFFDLYNFIDAYSSHPGFKSNFKKALESNIEFTFNYVTRSYPVQVFYLIHRAGSNLYEKEYNKISQGMLAEQSKMEKEYGEQYKTYLGKKAKYEELEKQYQDELQEYVKKSKAKKDEEPLPEKPERKFNPKPQEPIKGEVQLSNLHAKQIILYALSVDDVYKLDINLLKQAIEMLSDELSYEAKYGLEKMIMIITSANIDVADFNSHGISLTEDKDKILINLRNIQLIGSNLQNINLANADLSNANFTGANLVGAALENTNLSGANLSDAKLTKANLIDADLSGIVVNANTTLEGAKFFDESQSTKEIHQELDKIFSQLKTNPSFEYLSLAMAKDFIDKFIAIDCNRTMSSIKKQLDKNPDISYEQFDKFSDSLKKLLELVTQFKKHPLFNTVNLDEVQPRFDKYENEIHALMDRLAKNFDVRFHP